MRILLTNDDGIDEPGLAALEFELSGHELWTVAPRWHCSGVGQSLGLYQTLRVRELASRRWAVEGSPTDCVKLALNELMRGAGPELVISGINPGPNLANNVYYSGTVAAATEASFWGIPAFAVSQGWSEDPDFGVTASIVGELVAAGLHGHLPEGAILNVNVPRTGNGDRPAGYTWTTTGRFSVDIPFRSDGTGEVYSYRKVMPQPVADPEGTDVEAFEAGMVSLTLLRSDRSLVPSAELSGLLPG